MYVCMTSQQTPGLALGLDYHYTLHCGMIGIGIDCTFAERTLKSTQQPATQQSLLRGYAHELSQV